MILGKSLKSLGFNFLIRKIVLMISVVVLNDQIRQRYEISLKILMCYINGIWFSTFLNVFLHLFVDGHLDWKYKRFL